jgi:hypothetical protein
MSSLGLRAPAVLAALFFAAWPLAAQRREFTILARANYSGSPTRQSCSTPKFRCCYVDVGLLGSVGVEIGRLAFSGRIERSIVSLVDAGAIPTSPFDGSKLWSGSVSIEYLLRVL